MLTSAHPLFERVPGFFGDPLGLAAQQAPGVTSLILASYLPEMTTTQSDSPTSNFPLQTSHFYDAFVAVSGQLLAVARTTPDYRFPVTPATALADFFAARDDDRPPTLSLYELAEPDAARFVETAFFQECLKLHVDGSASADLVTAQLARAGCYIAEGTPTHADNAAFSGILEVNDFADPANPRLTLLDLADSDASLLDRLRSLLEGVRGRVLLYDRRKNRAVMPGRTGTAFDLTAAVAQANRLAEARRDAPTVPHDPDGTTTPTRTSEAAEETVRARFRPTAQPAPPREQVRDAPSAKSAPPHSQGLAALVAELQGRTTPTAPTDLRDFPGLPSLIVAAPEAEVGVSEDALDEVDLEHRSDPAEPVHCLERSSPPGQEGVGVVDRITSKPLSPSQSPDPVSALCSPPSQPPIPHPLSPGAPAPRHPLASDLDRLRADVYAAFEEAVGPERAAAHEAHVLAERGLPNPTPAAETLPYLRALLFDDPPRRWHFFKRQRRRLHAPTAAKLLTLHATHADHPHPDAQAAILAASKLWTRLHQ